MERRSKIGYAFCLNFQSFLNDICISVYVKSFISLIAFTESYLIGSWHPSIPCGTCRKTTQVCFDRYHCYDKVNSVSTRQYL